MSITLLDGILIVIMLISAILAMIRGFSREVLSIVSWVAAAVAAATFYKTLAPIIVNAVPSLANQNPLVVDGIAAVSIFLIVLIIVSYLTMRLADFIIDSRIGVLDRTLGFIFGAARGALLVIITLQGFLWLAQDNQPDWVANAKSKPLMESIGTTIKDALPENLEGMIKRFFEDGSEENKEGEQDTDQKT